MSAHEQVPQDVALALQLQAIAGSEPRSSLFEIRYRTTRGMRQLFVGLSEPDRAARAIRNHAQLGDVYIGACPRVRESGKADAVERVWALWADVDSPEALARLRAFRPLPSIAVETGTVGHVHAYWPLSEPIPGAWSKRALRRLARHLDADMSAAEPARVLRPVGSRNHKHDPPTRVECVRLELDAFTVAEVVGGLADDPACMPAVPAARRSVPESDAGAVLDGLVRTILEAPAPCGDHPGDRNNALFWAANRVREHIETGVGDATWIEALRDAARRAGLDDHAIEATLRSALGRQGAA